MINVYIIGYSQSCFYSICHSQQSAQSLHNFPFFSKQYDHSLHCLTFSAVWSGSKSTLLFSGTVWSGSTPFAILSSLSWSTLFYHYQQSIMVYTVLPLSAVWSKSRSILSFSGTVWSGSALFEILSKQYYQGLYFLPFSSVWSGSILFAIISLNRVYTVCHSQHSDLGLHCWPFSVWTESTLFAILSSLIRVYTTCHSQQCDQGQGFHCHSQ